MEAAGPERRHADARAATGLTGLTGMTGCGPRAVCPVQRDNATR